MKIDAITDNPQGLVTAINKAIKDEDLKTWKIVFNNKNETLYSHTPEQWDGKALLQPTATVSSVTFTVTWWIKEGEPDEAIKGYILGRFTEVLMVHFRDYFKHLIIT